MQVSHGFPSYTHCLLHLLWSPRGVRCKEAYLPSHSMRCKVWHPALCPRHRERFAPLTGYLVRGHDQDCACFPSLFLGQVEKWWFVTFPIANEDLLTDKNRQTGHDSSHGKSRRCHRDDDNECFTFSGHNVSSKRIVLYCRWRGGELGVNARKGVGQESF